MFPALLLLSAGGLFTVLPHSFRGDILSETLLPLVLAVSLAIAVSGRPSALATMAGAIAAFAGSVVWAFAPALGGAVILGLAYAERSTRVRPLRARLVHIGLSVVAGAAAGALTSMYADALVLYQGVAVVMAAVLASVPLFVPADDHRIHLLEMAAKRLGPPLGPTLLEGVELLRCGDISLLDRETAANVKKSWRALERLIEARLAMVDGKRKTETAALVTAMVDRQITEHIATLTRAYAAVTTMGAAEVGLDDSAVREVHARGEALDEQSRAIVEVGPH